MKPGYKTTEFWLSTFAQLVGLLAFMGVIEPAQSSQLVQAVTTIVGAITMIVPAVVYIINRTYLKSKIAN